MRKFILYSSLSALLASTVFWSNATICYAEEKNVGEKIVEKASEAKDTIKEKASEAQKKIKENASEFKSEVKEKTSELGSKIKNFLNSFKLEDNDKEGDGHTIVRHVGRSNDYLEGRLTGKGMKFASTYTDLETANKAIKETIEANSEKITAWLKGKIKKDRLSISKKFDSAIGKIMVRGEKDTTDAKIAVVVLKRHNKDEFRVLTSYPVSSEKSDKKN